MFVVVYYGENQSTLCNVSCKVLYLLMHLRKATKLEKQIDIDLCDENGKVMTLDMFTEENADRILAERGAYILLEKKMVPPKDVDGENKRPQSSNSKTFAYFPLLTNFSQKYPHLSCPLSVKAEKGRPRSRQSADGKSKKSPSKTKTNPADRQHDS